MAKKKQDEAPTSLDELAEKINRNMGEGTLVRATDKHWIRPVERISSGSLALDVALGGGFPRSRMTQIFGRESAAKSSLAYGAICTVQKKGGRTLLINIENDFDPEWAEAHGVDLTQLDVGHPETLNHAADLFEDAVRIDEYDIIVFDSVAAGTSMHEMGRSSTEAERGGTAIVINKMMRKVNSALLSKTKGRPNQTCIILVNQMRTSIGTYVPMDFAPGGAQLKYLPSVHIRLGWAKSDEVKELDTVFGNLGDTAKEEDKGKAPVAREIHFVIEKNKTFRPFLRGKFIFYYKAAEGRPVGVDRFEELLRLGSLAGVVKKSGAWFEIPNVGRFQGETAAIDGLRENQDVALALIPIVRKRLLEEADANGKIPSSVKPVEAEPLVQEEAVKPQVSESPIATLIDAGVVQRRGPAWCVVVSTGEVLRPKQAEERFDELMKLREGSDAGSEDGGGGAGESGAEAEPIETADEPSGRKGRGRKKRRADDAGIGESVAQQGGRENGEVADGSEVDEGEVANPPAERAEADRAPRRGRRKKAGARTRARR